MLLCCCSGGPRCCRSSFPCFCRQWCGLHPTRLLGARQLKSSEMFWVISFFAGCRFGPRFPAMSSCYDKGLRCLAMEVAKELDVAAIMQEGVYAMVGGPNFESIAEARLLHCVGVDAVGETRKQNWPILRGRSLFLLPTAAETAPTLRSFKYFNFHLTFK